VHVPACASVDMNVQYHNNNIIVCECACVSTFIVVRAHNAIVVRTLSCIVCECTTCHVCVHSLCIVVQC
jgi:hypothetical protein